jgi:2-C-methyl-D-erythritol 4-phosphate cytidylyltransferase
MARSEVPLPGRYRRPRGPGHAGVVVLGGGSGTRLGAEVNKVYLPLAGRRVLSWSLHWAAQVPEISTFVLVVRPEDVSLAEEVLHREARGLEVRLVVGGASRHESEDAALVHLAPYVEAGELDVVAVHDGARPLAGPSLFRSVVSTAAAVGGAVPVLSATGILPASPPLRPGGGRPAAAGPLHLPRQLARVQTPQAFRAKDLLAAYAAALDAGFRGTDTASTVERFSDLVVQTVAGTRANLKVTYPHDMFLAERLLAAHRYRLP